MQTEDESQHHTAITYGTCKSPNSKLHADAMKAQNRQSEDKHPEIKRQETLGHCKRDGVESKSLKTVENGRICRLDTGNSC